MKIFFILILLAVFVPSAIAKDKEQLITVRGQISFGTLDSSIEEANTDNYITFLTNSKAGSKILSVCKVDGICEVTAVVSGKYKTLVSLKKVLRIKEAQ